MLGTNYILCEKNWTHTRSGTGSYGRQVADEIQVNLEIFKNHCTSKDSTFASFNQGTASLQQQKCIPCVFRVESIVKLVFKVGKFMKPYDILPIPIIKYYCT